MIVTADDFGRDENRNRAIVRAFHEGLITHASLMANMPGFAEACQLAHEHRLEDRIGAHVVLTEGAPLTADIRATRFCESGAFHDWAGRKHIFHVSRAEARAVAAEFSAQLERCREQGLPLSHVDSHHHVHNEVAVVRALLPVARRLEVPRVRIARNCGPGIGIGRRAYKLAFNTWLRVRGVAGSRYFGDFDDLEQLAATRDGAAKLAAAELMTHPMLDEGDRLVDELAPETPLDELVRRVSPVPVA